MQGIWKERLGGWNSKDSRRKPQKRKHTLKDKARGLMKASLRADKEISSIEESPKLVSKTVLDNGGECEFDAIVFLAKVRHRKNFRPGKVGYDEFEETHLKVYHGRSGWNRSETVYNTGRSVVDELGLRDLYLKRTGCDYVTDYTIREEFGLSVELVREVYYITWDIGDASRFSIEVEEEYPRQTVTVAYGRVVPQSHRFLRRPSRKYEKAFTARRSRRIARDAISRGLYDSCLDRHPYCGSWFDW